MEGNNRDYTHIMQLYNNFGSKSACEFIQSSYGIKYPGSFLMNMKKAEKYRFDKAGNKFMAPENIDSPKSVFLDLEELCVEKSGSVTAQIQHGNHTDREQLIQSLIYEKLLKYTKYIQLDSYANTVAINKSALRKDGYNIAIY